MRLIATTVVRESAFGRQKTGWIYDVDWAAQRVERRFPTPDPRFPSTEENPRGGMRGGRGVAVTRHGIVVAVYDTLWRYDDDWNVLAEVSHPLFVGIHEIDWDGEHMWVTATGIDAILKADLEGEAEVAWDPHTPELARRFGLRTRPDPVDGSVDYRIRQAPLIDQCHVNGVIVDGSSMVVNCGSMRTGSSAVTRFAKRVLARTRRALPFEERPRTTPRYHAPSMVVRVDGAGKTDVLLTLPPGGHPTHNGRLLDDGRLAVNHSTSNHLRLFRLSDQEETASIHVEGTWLRGLEPISPSQALVGTAPAAIALVDLECGVVERRLQLSDDPNEAVHGLAVCPEPVERP